MIIHSERPPTQLNRLLRIEGIQNDQIQVYLLIVGFIIQKKSSETKNILEEGVKLNL